MINEIISIHPYYEVETNTYGYGVLSDILSCTVTQELGGSYELEMTYPVDGARYEYIELNNIIRCHATPYGSNTGYAGEGDATREAFRIYEISRPINKIVTVRAQHYRYDLSGVTVAPYETTEETKLSDFISFILTHCSPSNDNNRYFAFLLDSGVGDKTGKPISSTVPVSLLSLLGGDENSIPSSFGVELWFQNKSILVKEKPDIPSGNPKVNIMYAKNMTDFTWDTKSDNFYTDVYPFFYFENSDGVGQLYELPEKTVSTGLGGIPDKWYLLDLSSSWVNDRYNWRDEYPTIEEMREVTNDFITENGLGFPVHSFTVSYIDESRINNAANYGYSDLEKCYLGDYVGVTFPDYECYTILRIVKTTYNAVRDQYESIELGEITQSLSSGISANQLSSSNFASGLASQLAAEKAVSITTQNLVANVAKIDTLTADDAIITNVAAVAITTERIEAAVADIGYIKTDELDAEVARIGYLKTSEIESETGRFHYLAANQLEAGYANINFANVNVANIQSAKLTEFFSRSGYVQHQTIDEQDVQYLRGVKIVGDIIEADTISAKSLILRTESETGDYTDGLIWQINAQSGELTQQQLTQEQYRRKLDGTDLVAHSVTAREITTERIQGSTGYIQFGDEVLDDGTIIRGPNINLNNQLIFRNGDLQLNLSSLDVRIQDAVEEVVGDELDKLSSARVFTSSSSSISLDTIKSYCAAGTQTQWSNLTPSTLDCKVGDLVYVKRKCSTFNDNYLYCKGTVAETPSSQTSITLSMLGFEAPMPTSNPIAYINATGETVKIAASHIDITGAVTFSSFDSSLQSSYNSVSNNASTALTNAATAQSTANSASTAASNAQSTANTANSTASNALNLVSVQDTRNDNQNPLWYMNNYPKKTVREFKTCSKIGISGYGTYCTLETYVPWSDSSGGYPTQVAYCNNSTGKGFQVTFKRTGTSNTAWSTWRSVDVTTSTWAHSSDVTKIDGGTIYTNSIKANSIDVTDLFAQNITASGSITCYNANETFSVNVGLGYIKMHAADQSKSMAEWYENMLNLYPFNDGTSTHQPTIHLVGGNYTGGGALIAVQNTSGSDYVFIKDGGIEATADIKASNVYENGSKLSDKYLAKGGSIASGNTAGVTGGTIYSWLRSTNNRLRSSTEFGSKSVNHDTSTDLGSVTLSPGAYVLKAAVIENAATGTYQIWAALNTTSGSGGMDRYSAVTEYSFASRQTKLQVTKIIVVTSNTTVYLTVHHYAGSARTFGYSGIEYLKIY